MKQKHLQFKEEKHFDQLVKETGEIWWGSTTAAGLRRLQRRGRLIAKALAHMDKPKILEIGCGTGALTRAVLEEFPGVKLVSVDISSQAVENARHRYSTYLNVIFEKADATALPYAADSFDAVVGNSILHHLPVEAAMKESLRVLKSEGMILFSEPNMLNPQIAVEKNVPFIKKALQNSDDETAFFRWKLKNLLIRTGFEAVSVEPFDFLHPAVPKKLIPFMEGIGKIAEKTFLLKEIAGSLLITAFKPTKEIREPGK